MEIISDTAAVSEILETSAITDYISITMKEAGILFETPGDYLIVDVRRPDEFAQGHIPGAVNIPNEDISIEMPSGLPDKEQTIYIYCRSGNRSKQASAKLAAMGYTHIIEFGGILDWDGNIVTE
ncbi:MAG: rhodanese-like domain-containing protein [Clostridia bacterium]|nr:rhodanese-like domain-containing protein [Clostridia bacterium]